MIIQSESQKSTKNPIQPTSLRIQADNQDRRRVVCFWLFFILVVIGSIAVSIAGPSQTIQKTNKTQLRNTVNNSTCSNPYGFDNKTLICQQFGESNHRLGLIMRGLSILHQNALIKLQLPSNAKPKNQTLKIHLYVINFVVKNNQGMFEKGDHIREEELRFQTVEENNFQIGYYRHLEDENYLLVVEFQTIEGMIKHNVKPQMKAILINPVFTVFIIVFRGVFLLITLFTTCVYFCLLKKVPTSQIIIQQKLTKALSISVIFFNDPIYPLTVLLPRTLTTILSTLFVVQFIVILLFYWILCLQRILYEEGQRSWPVTRCKKIIILIYFIVFFALFTAFYSSIAVHQIQDKIILPPYVVSLPLFIVFSIFAFIVFGYLIWLYCKILCQGQYMLWRTSIWLGFSCYFILALMGSLIAESVGAYNSISTKIIIFYVAMNLYVVYMQYMWTSAEEQFSSVKNAYQNVQQFRSMNEKQSIMEDSVVIDMNQNI